AAAASVAQAQVLAVLAVEREVPAHFLLFQVFALEIALGAFAGEVDDRVRGALERGAAGQCGHQHGQQQGLYVRVSHSLLHSRWWTGWWRFRLCPWAAWRTAWERSCPRSAERRRRRARRAGRRSRPAPVRGLRSTAAP